MKNIYFFYDPASKYQSELAAIAPGLVGVVKWGWSPKIEAERNALLMRLSVNVTSLPSLVLWKADADVMEQDEETGEQVVVETIPAHWVVIPGSMIPKPWTWDWRVLPRELR